MPTLTIDDQEITVEPGTVLIQACEQAGVEIPRFCYHERLAIAGNCRMCLVEVSPGPPKPQASCALPCADGQVVKTNSDMVKKAREGAMEFLLINHPLDCPICDQGGECDLQDQAMAYGKGTSRFDEMKRSVEDKTMGPLIKTYMNRCIHCTRCVRFITDVAGVPELGGLGRGNHMEIGTYVEKAISSELSGNIIDLCPVGALTSKPYSFVARPWELTKTETIDVMDAVGSNIRVDSKGEAVLRVLPRVHEEINEEWIADKTRYACDGLKAQRLDQPYIRREGKLQPASWGDALTLVASKISEVAPENTAAVVGNQACTESIYALKKLMEGQGVTNLECRQEGANFAATSRADYLFNSTIAGIEEADAILLIGTNPRIEAPLINARIRKRSLSGGLKVFSIGDVGELTYAYENIGEDPGLLQSILDGKNDVAKTLEAAKKPMVIIGTAAAAREDGDEISDAARALGAKLSKDGWQAFNFLHHAAARVGALDVGFLPKDRTRSMADLVADCGEGKIELLYLLGVDEIAMRNFGAAFIVYQGHHGDIGAHRADVILPGAAYTEKEALYVNTEGRPQLARRAVFPPGQAREDWKILRALSEKCGEALPFDSLPGLRQQLFAEVPHLAQIDVITSAGECSDTHKTHRISSEPFEPLIRNFYRTDPISRVSKTMAECTKVAAEEEKKAA